MAIDAEGLTPDFLIRAVVGVQPEYVYLGNR